MKLVILYRPNSDHARRVEEFVHEFKRRDPTRQAELVSLDTREGANLAKLYDVTRYPALLALSNNGQLLQWWQGDQLPLMDEVVAYVGSEVATKGGFAL